VTDWGWESDKPGYDVERGFSLPFVRESNRVRLYGSPASIAAIDDMQQELNLLNRAQRGDGDRTGAYKAIYAAYDKFVIAARKDVGPRDEEGWTEEGAISGRWRRTAGMKARAGRLAAWMAPYPVGRRIYIDAERVKAEAVKPPANLPANLFYNPGPPPVVSAVCIQQ